MQRDSQETRRKILSAVGALLARSGFRDVGINSVAREAGVDKVLIYRYFGGLAELLTQFAGSSEFWPSTAELQAGGGSPESSAPPEQAKRLLLSFGRALRERPLTQEIMRWELLERNGITDALARQREQQGVALMQQIEDAAGVDLQAIGSLLSAGLIYLILRSKTADVFNGLDLSSEEDWQRIEEATAFLVDSAFASGASGQGA